MSGEGQAQADDVKVRPLPFVDLAAQWLAVRERVEAAMAEVHASTSYILGPQLDRFEGELADAVGVEHVVGVASGTHAIAYALKGLGIGRGDEVIMPAMSFIATAEAVAEIGAWPVLADVDPDSGLVLPEAVEAAAGPRTAALLPVHLYGQPADMAALGAIAGKLGIAIVEDACQAHGARSGTHRAGSLGDAGAFSFYPSKNLGCYGDGGAVATSDAAVADRVRRLRNHGASSKYVHEEIATTGRLDTLQAAALSAKLPLLDGWNARRAGHARRYAEALAGIEGLALPAELPRRSHVWHVYQVRLDDRDGARERLAAAGIGSNVHYPIPLHLQPALRHLGLKEGAFPGAEALARRSLSLPMYPELPEDAPARVAAVLRAPG